MTLTPGTPIATLCPGGQADVLLTVSNPNTSPVHIGSLALDTGQGTGGFAVDAGHSGCAVSTLSFTTQTNGVGAANACQGATSTVYLAAGP